MYADQRARKTLVVGSTGFTGVTCVNWFDGPVPNAADFDLVLVNGLTLRRIFSETPGDEKKGKPVKLVNEWRAWLTELRERLRKLLKSGGHVFAIVTDDAVTYGMRTVDSMKGPVPIPRFVSNDDWLPLPITFNTEQGDTCVMKDMQFARYMANVRRWEFHLSIGGDGDQASEIAHEHSEHEVVVRLLPIAVNRQGSPIAATFYYTIHERSGRRTLEVPSGRSGDLHILPPPTIASDDEAGRVILEDFCGVAVRQIAPEWAASVAMPGTNDLDQQIQSKYQAINDIQSALAPVLAERERRERLKAILYETGIEPLQEVVETVFKELGLATKPSSVSDEFVVEHEGRELLVEVKGNEKSAKLTDLRQLIDYQLQHEQKHGSAIKSVLIVNAWRSVEPEKRGQGDTVIFPDNVVRRSVDNNIALLDTVELFNALNAFWLQHIDGPAVFEAIMSTSGVAKLP